MSALGQKQTSEHVRIVSSFPPKAELPYLDRAGRVELRSDPPSTPDTIGVVEGKIVSGLLVLYGLLNGISYPGWTALFLATTILTSITGFPIPPFGFDPPRAVGTLSLVLLAIAVCAFYAFHLAGTWRWVYVVTATAALYLNCFVAVVQAFGRVPSLQALAPTQSETPFLIAVRKFHPRAAV